MKAQPVMTGSMTHANPTRKGGIRAIIKGIAVVFGVILAILLLGVGALAVYSQLTFKRTLANRPLYAIQADTSTAGVDRGKYLVENVMGCAGACHTPQEGVPLSGTADPIAEGPIQGVFAVPNLTPDLETGLGSWTDAEIARAIREGIDKDGVALVVMPSFTYHQMSDADVAAIIGYLRSLEPVQNEIPPMQLNLVAKMMYTLGMLGPKSVMDPIRAPQEAPTAGTADYGQYLVALGACRDCHGENLSGGAPLDAGPDAPLTPNLTPGGEMVGWLDTAFITTMRTGITPSGRQLSEAMPWKDYGGMTDEDLRAIFQYLHSLPARSAGE